MNGASWNVHMIYSDDIVTYNNAYTLIFYRRYPCFISIVEPVCLKCVIINKKL